MRVDQFPRLAEALNPHIDINDFKDHYTELYLNRFNKVKSGLFGVIKSRIADERLEDEIDNKLDEVILNYKFDKKMKPILKKFRFYTLAHVRLIQITQKTISKGQKLIFRVKNSERRKIKIFHFCRFLPNFHLNLQRNYLRTLSLYQIQHNRINWGLMREKRQLEAEREIEVN